MVRKDEIAPVVPADAGGKPAGSRPVGDLRKPRLLNWDKIKAALIERARAEGFDVVGVTKPDSIGQWNEYLHEWLAAGSHGDMDWLASTRERREDPRVLWPDVKSVVVFGLNYGPDENPLSILEQKSRGGISVYARGDDYHDLIKGKLKRLGQWLASQTKSELKVFVDTAPVMEKPLAEAAGLGWQGKHTNLVSRTHGSWLFLGVLFTNLDLPADEKEPDHCGSCRNCLDVCPTNAFPAPYRLNARKCISYLTIEHKGPIPFELREAMGNRIYGCDDCLAVCPWNKFAQDGREAKLAARDENRAPALAELSRLDDTEFRQRFSKSPIKRTGRVRFLRNVLIAIGNSGDAKLAVDAKRLLEDESPLIRGAAVWALSRLLPKPEFSALPARTTETDASVKEEWSQALA
jgi:epoxyqueuosine reductase